MSFSAMVKRELVQKLPDPPECRKAMLCGLLDNNLRFFQHENGIYLFFESPYPAEAGFQLIRQLLPVSPEVRNRYGLNGLQYRSYEVFVPGTQKLSALTGLLWGDLGAEVYTIGEASPEVDRYYLAGAFLSGGHVSEPMGKSHLELSLRTRACAEAIRSRLALFDVEATVRQRTRSSAEPTYVCYIKNGEKIADFLRIIGATQAICEWENARAMKEVRNNVNRRCNCDFANAIKVSDASGRQVEAIRRLKETGQFDTLEASLKEIAALRLSYPELSVVDLGNMLTPALSKSGTYHRLQKLVEIAENK